MAGFISAVFGMVLQFFVIGVMKKNSLRVSYINGYGNLFRFLSWAKMNNKDMYVWFAYSTIFFNVIVIIFMILYIVTLFGHLY